MEILDELKDRVELDESTQKKVLAATPLALIGGAVIAAWLRNKPLHVRESVVALSANGRRVAQELAAKIPFWNKSKS